MLHTLRSGDYVVRNLPVDVGQAEVAAGELVGQSFMIQPQKVEHRRVQIMDVHPVLDRVPAKLVRSTVSDATAYATSREPHRKTKGMMIPAVLSFSRRCPPKLAAPDHQRIVEQATGFEVQHQSGDRLICRKGILLVPRFQTAVLIPGLKASGRMIKLHKTNTSFDQATGHPA